MSDIRLNSWDENRKVKPYFTTDICTRTDYLKYVKQREIGKLKRLAKRKIKINEENTSNIIISNI